MRAREGALIVLIAAVAAFGASSAEPKTARDIVSYGDEQMRAETSTGVYEMTITNPDWERSLRMRFWENVEGDKAFVRILSPPREKGSASLKLGNEMWTYLPSVERSMKIPPSMMSQSWMGSDLTNEDIVNGDDYVHLYDHTIVDTTEVNGFESIVIESVPQPQAAVVWGKILYYARMDDYLPIRQDYYDEDDELVRRMDYAEFKVMDGHMVPTVYTVIPLTEEDQGRQTILKIQEIQFDVPIRGDVFTRRNLERTR